MGVYLLYDIRDSEKNMLMGIFSSLELAKQEVVSYIDDLRALDIDHDIRRQKWVKGRYWNEGNYYDNSWFDQKESPNFKVSYAKLNELL